MFKEIDKRIRKHLEIQYKGIFLKEQIDNHISQYIQDNQSNCLIQKIEPLIKSGSKILDVGSGYGSFVLEALRHGYDSYGVEIETFEHEISKERAMLESFDPTRFSLGSAMSLSYPDESFDVISFWNVLEHVPDYKKAISEAKRVLKPDGLIFIIAPNYCSFRKEAHYHVPWVPMFPKTIAKMYLKYLKRETYFLDNCIFYISMFGLKKYVKSQNLHISTNVLEKIERGINFNSTRVNAFIRICKRYYLTYVLRILVLLLKTHPFSHSIDIILRR